MFTVQDLAKELRVDAAEILAACETLGIVASSGASGLSSAEHVRLREFLGASPELPPVVRGSTERVPNPPPAQELRSLRERAAALDEPPARKLLRNPRAVTRTAIYLFLFIAVAVAVVMFNRRNNEPLDVPVLQNFMPADVGTCVDFSDDGPQLVEVECGTRHDAQLLHVAEAEDDDVYPGQGELEDGFEPACRRAFRDATGTSYDESPLSVVFLLPTPTTWAIGDRTMLCLVEDPGEKLVGSIWSSGG